MDLSGKQLGGLLLLVAGLIVGSVAAGNYMASNGTSSADTTASFDGEFEAVGLASYEEPFEGLNFFDEMTVASANSDDVMTGAMLEKTVSTAPTFVDRSAVSYFELDGSVEATDMEIVGNDSVDEVSINSITFYDYEAAVDNNDLERGEVSVTSDVDGLDAEIEAGQLSEGEYALAVEYQFNDYSQSAATSVTLGDLTAEIDTDGDVDEVGDTPINLITE
jgi:hypothetical protein